MLYIPNSWFLRRSRELRPKTFFRILRAMASKAASNGVSWSSMSSSEYTALGNATIPDRKQVEDTLKRRFFVSQSFELYGGVSGLYDFGPIGCSIKANLVSEWRRHFVIEDQMLEVETSMLTPESVLKASGHVDRFSDLMVKDLVKGDLFRADHLIEEHLCKLKSGGGGKIKDVSLDEVDRALARVGDAGMDEICEMIARFGVKSPLGNDLSQPVEFNLMFSTMIGATGGGLHKSYLRPETAQGIFVNFKRLLAFNQGRLPFAAAQIGYSFRNEIAPRAGLLRVREFPMAEIEYFVDPTKKHRHAKFATVSDYVLTLFPRSEQVSSEPRVVRLSVGEAVRQKCIDNQSLAYFMVRIDKFLTKCGIDRDKLRFRQHLQNEMAHYASDCWDAECLTSYGWVECVGCADRSCYDLEQHSRATETDLVVERAVSPAKEVDWYELKFDRKAIGMKFKAKSQEIVRQLVRMKQTQLKNIHDDSSANLVLSLLPDHERVEVDRSLVEVSKTSRRIEREEFVPSVIEPSFGIGRVLYSIWEHSIRSRPEDAQRVYFSLPNAVAPYIATVLPLSGQETLMEICEQVSDLLRDAGIAHRVERSSSTSIGKRYARCDEIGIPYAVTIDFESVNNQDCTIRQRDSMQQVRLKIKELAQVLLAISSEKLQWNELRRRATEV